VWNKDTFFKNLGLTILLISNRLLRFTYVSVYFYFMPFFAIIVADLLTRNKDQIAGSFSAPAQ